MFKKFKPFFKVTDRSDNVSEGSVFFALKGKNHTEIDFLEDVVSKKCSAIFIEKDLKISVEDYNKILNNLNFNGKIFFLDEYLERMIERDPGYASTHKMKYKNLFLYEDFCNISYRSINLQFQIYAVTGTKGKTTTTILINEMFKSLGYKTAMLSGAYNQILDEKYQSEFTTDKPDYIYAFLDEAYHKGVTHIIIEVSAQALTLNRVRSLFFNSIILTNFSDDHNEFYKNNKEYFFDKMSILKNIDLEKGEFYFNIDETECITFFKEYKKELKEDLEEENINFSCKYFSESNTKAHINAVVNNNSFEKTSFKLIDKLTKKNYLVESSLIGNYNINNILAAYLLVDRATQEIKDENLKNWDFVFKSIENIEIPGRANRYKTKEGVFIYIDMAHSIEAFKLTLLNLRKQTNDLIVIFGCGGDRDLNKRKTYARISEEFCNKIYITEDNPRSEDLDKINNDILAGFKNLNKVKVIKDREEAIKEAISNAKEGSIVAILGKGIQQYQIRKNEKIEYSDLSSIQSNFDIFAI